LKFNVTEGMMGKGDIGVLTIDEFIGTVNEEVNNKRAFE
jgi:hypothetical protein